MGTDNERSALTQRTRTLDDASLSHADRRLDPDRAAARGKYRPHDDPGSRGRARRNAKPAHEFDGRSTFFPTESAARIALRTQQVIAHESGVADTVDPLAGSYAIEELTTRLEEKAEAYIEKIDAMGGMLRAIETGYVQREIQEAAYDLSTGSRNQRRDRRRRQ